MCLIIHLRNAFSAFPGVEAWMLHGITDLSVFSALYCLCYCLVFQETPVGLLLAFFWGWIPPQVELQELWKLAAKVMMQNLELCDGELSYTRLKETLEYLGPESFLMVVYLGFFSFLNSCGAIYSSSIDVESGISFRLMPLRIKWIATDLQQFSIGADKWSQPYEAESQNLSALSQDGTAGNFCMRRGKCAIVG